MKNLIAMWQSKSYLPRFRRTRIGYGGLSKKHKLPAHMLLIPGVVETTSNFVEHPEVVARRIEEAVAAVGERERVIASTENGPVFHTS